MQKLEFGTAGIRGILGEGEEFLNVTHIYRVVDAYARYLIKNFPNAKEKGVVIGRDNRRESISFSKAAAATLDSYGIKVYFSKNICPTPFVSFAIKYFQTVGGINITASHNPKEFNGIKVYNGFGGQILPSEVKQLQKFFKPYNEYLGWNKAFGLKNNILHIPKKVYDEYQKRVVQVGSKDLNCSNIKIAFSPLHGTGSKIVQKIFEQLQVKAFYVDKQMINNRHFTYTKSPNPESPLAYDEVIKVGIKNQCDLVLVTDPDADRVGLGVWDSKTNKYVLLNGNETATLIFQYLLDIEKSKNLKDKYLIYSFVSTTLPKIMAKQNGVRTIEIETGFKWVSGVINKQLQNKTMLFAFEESYGSLIDDSLSVDKDAIQSVVVLTKMAAFYKKQGLTFLDLIKRIYQKYGYISSQVVAINLDKNRQNQLKNLKKAFVTTNYGLEIDQIIDYNQGYQDIQANDTITIKFKNNCWIALRPSGTEPKLKIYIFAIGKTKTVADDLNKQLFSHIKAII